MIVPEPQIPNQEKRFSGNRIYFISDLHLGSRYLPDKKRAERNIVSFLDSISYDATEIYLLGDILDYWFEYRYVVPRGFVRFFGKLAELADSGVKITWLIGNHDIWIFDYLPDELGIEVVDGALIRKMGEHIFFLSHGDGMGERSWTFRFMRTLFRNKFCQKLYSGIHPRWTVPFALGWSRNSRQQGLAGNNDTIGVRKLQEFAASHHASNPEIDFYIFGHVHSQSRMKLPPVKEGTAFNHSISGNETNTEAEVLTLGGWTDVCDYLVFDGTELQSHKWEIS